MPPPAIHQGHMVLGGRQVAQAIGWCDTVEFALDFLA
jgi:hypothetical protein